jgi:hypothetical protein
LEERNEENEIIVCRRSLGQEQTGCSDSRDRSRGFSLLFLSDQAVREEIVADGYIDRLAGSIRQILLLTKSNLEKRSTWSIDPPLILLLRPSILPLPRGAPSDLHFHITLLTPPSDSHIQTSLSPPLYAPPRADGSSALFLTATLALQPISFLSQPLEEAALLATPLDLVVPTPFVARVCKGVEGGGLD